MSDELPRPSPSDPPTKRKPQSFTLPRDMVRDFMNYGQLVTERRLVVGALLGVCFVFLATFLAIPHRDTPLQVALFAFVIAISLLGAASLAYAINLPPGLSKRDGLTTDDRMFYFGGVAGAGGTIAVIVGITAVVWHLNSWAVVVGCVAVLLASLASSALARWMAGKR